MNAAGGVAKPSSRRTGPYGFGGLLNRASSSTHIGFGCLCSHAKCSAIAASTPSHLLCVIGGAASSIFACTSCGRLLNDLGIPRITSGPSRRVSPWRSTSFAYSVNIVSCRASCATHVVVVPLYLRLSCPILFSVSSHSALRAGSGLPVASSNAICSSGVLLNGDRRASSNRSSSSYSSGW